jgi:hypothetical protein
MTSIALALVLTNGGTTLVLSWQPTYAPAKRILLRCSPAEETETGRDRLLTRFHDQPLSHNFIFH